MCGRWETFRPVSQTSHGRGVREVCLKPKAALQSRLTVSDVVPRPLVILEERVSLDFVDAIAAKSHLPGRQTDRRDARQWSLVKIHIAARRKLQLLNKDTIYTHVCKTNRRNQGQSSHFLTAGIYLSVKKAQMRFLASLEISLSSGKVRAFL